MLKHINFIEFPEVRIVKPMHENILQIDLLLHPNLILTLGQDIQQMDEQIFL